MMRPLSKLAILLSAAVLTLGLPLLSNAQSFTLSSFTIGAAPNPVVIDSYTTLSAAVTGLAGVPAPDGTIDFYISSSSASCSADLNDIGTVTLSQADTATLNFYVRTTGTVAICAYYAAIDTNYAPATAGPIVLTVYSLNTIKPASAIVGSGNTNVTLTGLGFTGNSVPQINVNGVSITLPVNSLTATAIQTTIPAAELATAASLQVQVVTGALTSGPVSFQVYSPYTVNTSVSANPATFAYGSTLTSVLSGPATRSVATDAAVPAGPVNFVLKPASGPNITLGTAQLSQVTNPGAYFNTYTGLFDNNGTQKIIAIDLNGDGNADVVGLPGVTYGQTAFAPFLQVFLSTGANAFQTEEDVYTVCAAVDFAVGDINNDGIPDLVVVCPGPLGAAAPPPLQAYYMLGIGDGTFGNPVQFGSASFVSSPSQVVLGNFNNDGHNDIAVIDGTDGFFQIISPFGTATYGPYVDFDISNGSVVSAGAADFNQDGLTDIVLEEYIYPDGDLTSGAVLSLVNSLISGGAPGFTLQSETQFYAETYFMQSMTVTDVNGDGFPDVAIADPGDNYSGSPDTGNILIFENDGAGDLPLTLTYPAANAGAVAGAPFPLVGAPATTAPVAPGWNLLYSAQGTNGDIFVTGIQRQSASAWTQVSTADTGTSPYNTDGGIEPGFIVTGDMNDDGFLDFAATGTAIIGDQTTFELLPYYYGNDAQAPLNVSTTLPAPGAYTLNMTYAGNKLFKANNTATTPITISQGTVIGILTGPTTAAYQSTVTITATIAGVAGAAVPSGSVSFYDGTTLLNTVLLTAGAAHSTATDSVSNLSAGNHLIQISYGGDPNYAPAATTALRNLTVKITPATPTISWTTPAAITYGTALSTTQLDATSGVPGSFAYTPALNTVLAVGSHTLSVNLTPTDTTDYTAATATVTLTVSKATLTVTANNASRIYETANPAFTDAIIGFVNGDPQSVVSGAASLATTATLASTVGTYPITTALGTLSASNYAFKFVNGTLTITQATPAIAWATPAAITYGTALSATQLDATSTAPGTFTYNPASGAVLTAGAHTLIVNFAPADATDYTTATGSIAIQVNKATPLITWPSPGTMNYGTPLSSTQLDATATPPGGTFTYNPPAGTSLPLGIQTLSVDYAPVDTLDYVTATATTTVNVVVSLALTSIAPTSAPFGSPATTITLTGAGFTPSSVVQLNGNAIASTYVNPSQMTAQIPSTFFEQVSPGSITVFDPSSKTTSASAVFSVTPANLQATFTGPSNEPPGEQPTLNLTLAQAYPIPLTGTMTLTVEPLAPGGPTDPSVQFSTGGTTFNFTVPAGSTTTPTIQIQTGTLAATITVTLLFEANGQDVTPTGIKPIVIKVPATAPVITGVTLSRSGNTLIVTVMGFSSTRDMSQAAFDFTAAPGSSIANPELNVPVNRDFVEWYTNDSSIQFGSSFSYEQDFNLSNNASTIGSVSVTLTNSVGESESVTAH